MDPPPNLIAPVIIVACALIVVGGIGTALSSSADDAATVVSPGAPPGNGTAVRPAGTTHGAAGPAATGTGAGGAEDEAAPGANATDLSPNATAANVTAGAGTRPEGIGRPAPRPIPRLHPERGAGRDSPIIGTVAPTCPWKADYPPDLRACPVVRSREGRPAAFPGPGRH